MMLSQVSEKRQQEAFAAVDQALQKLPSEEGGRTIYRELYDVIVAAALPVLTERKAA